MRVPDTTKIDTAVPSWHINGHGQPCREEFSVGLRKGVGGHVERRLKVVGHTQIHLLRVFVKWGQQRGMKL